MTYSNEQLHRAYSDEYHAHQQTKETVKRLTLELAYQRKINKARQYLIKRSKSDLATIDRMLNKATTICLQDDMLCVMNDEWIFYFGTTKNKQKTKEFYKFYKQFDLKGKKLEAKGLSGYKNHVKTSNNLHIWL